MACRWRGRTAVSVMWLSIEAPASCVYAVLGATECPGSVLEGHAQDDGILGGCPSSVATLGPHACGTLPAGDGHRRLALAFHSDTGVFVEPAGEFNCGIFRDYYVHDAVSSVRTRCTYDPCHS